MDPGKRAQEILKNTAKEIKGAHLAALKDAGQESKKVFLDELDKVTSGRRFRNVGKGAKLSVGYEVTTAGAGGRMKLKAKGPWQIIERDTKPHAIRPRGKKKKRAVSFGGRAYAHVTHPGTKGKHPFEKGQVAARPKVNKIVAHRYITAVGKAW